MCTNNCIHSNVKNVVHYKSLVFLTHLCINHGTGFHFWRGPKILKLFKKTISKGVFILKCTGKRFIFLLPSISTLNISPIQNLRSPAYAPPNVFYKYIYQHTLPLYSILTPLWVCTYSILWIGKKEESPLLLLARCTLWENHRRNMKQNRLHRSILGMGRKNISLHFYRNNINDDLWRPF